MIYTALMTSHIGDTCHFEICYQAEQVNSSYQDTIGSTRLNLRFPLDSMHQDDNRM